MYYQNHQRDTVLVSALTPLSSSLIEAINVLNSRSIRSAAPVSLHHRVDQSVADQWISRLISKHSIQSVEDGKTLAKYQTQIALGSEAICEPMYV